MTNYHPDAGALHPDPPLWLVLLMTTAAGAMGWGIRGQYGHETGAMVPGLLVALSLAFLFAKNTGSLHMARAVSLAVIGISFGGSMTYGQTVGLTHDVELRGNWPALRWGMLGLFVKGGIWIGLAGGFLGIGLSAKKYRVLEVAILVIAMIALMFVGIYLLNEPYQPEADSPLGRQLPRIYFSDHWHWEPDKADLSPRRERWGGLLFALVGLIVYLRGFKKDSLAGNLALIGILAGGLGFVGGQIVQAFHAWNPEVFQRGTLARIDPYMNWWNTMETIFGAVLGFGLGLGVWLHRHLLPIEDSETDQIELSPATEGLLIVLHLAALVGWSFVPFRAFGQFAGHALTVGIVPIMASVGGRYFPYLNALPLVALPIAGKTLRQLCYQTGQISAGQGWLFLFVVPMVVMVLASVFFIDRSGRGGRGRSFARWSLLLATWFYFWLNFAFFEFPWPWFEPTSRTPAAAIFFACASLLSVAALSFGWRPVVSSDEGEVAR